MTTLYHYCSNNAFHSTVESQSIWLSSLTLSNDSMEGKLVKNIISHIANDENLDSATTQGLLDLITGLEGFIDGLGYCLSKEGDLLSQWRGYADDATGVSIGFSKEYLKRLSETTGSQDVPGFTLQKVEYGLNKQIKMVKPTYKKLKSQIDNGALKIPGARGLLETRSADEIARENEVIKDAYKNLTLTVFTLFKELYLLKNEAFSEEREWRLLSYLLDHENDDCLFYSQGNRIIPYREFALTALDINPINEIIIGPKNITPKRVIDKFLKKHGFMDVDIKRSSASYR